MTAKLLLATFCTLVLSVPAAHACGGFFCTTVPMNQVAENILFIQGEGTVTTHVQIQYSGTAADFAWILPLPAVPELAVSHNQIFTQLQSATQPDFQLNFVDEGGCYDSYFYDLIFGGCSACADVGNYGPPGVEVVAQEQVGPYDTAVVSSEDAQAIVDWLVDNGYQLGDLGVELLTPYVEEGFYFLALKLSPDRDVGDLQPIAVTYTADAPGIPIRLTAVATEPDLGVLAYILGEHRAVPTNYRHVQINEALIDWFNSGFNYQQVVTQAANEAGGQAFATDYAGPSNIVRDFFRWEFDLVLLRQQDHPADFLNEALWQGFPPDAQMQTLVRRHIPIPPAVLEEEVLLEVMFAGDREAYERAQEEGWLQDTAESFFYNNMRAYDRYLTDFAFDAHAFVDDLERIVVEPLESVRQLLEEKPYLTRLYTTLSADEMTLDPMFAYNPDLPDVSNVRSADLRTDCADDLGDMRSEGEWEVVITLSDGREFRSHPLADGMAPRPLPLVGQPAAAVIEQLSTSGPPQVIRTLPTTIEATAAPTPTSWSLLPNYPNPFNASTILPFVAPNSAPAALHIYNLHGQKVRTLTTDQVAAGYGEVAWDGRDHSGRVVASGVYLYRLEAEGVELTRKLLFLR